MLQPISQEPFASPISVTDASEGLAGAQKQIYQGLSPRILEEAPIALNATARGLGLPAATVPVSSAVPLGKKESGAVKVSIAAHEMKARQVRSC